MKYRCTRFLNRYSRDGRIILADFRAYLQAYLDFISTDADATIASRQLVEALRGDLEELNRAEKEAAACLDRSPVLQQLPRGDMMRYLYAMALTCNNKSLFITRDSKIGVGPAETKEGDEIVVFYGAATPFVIRRVEPSEQWQLIGSAPWVQGLMDGEAMKGELKEQEWFDLV
ncbi:hypothetical protein EDD36DRAFT_461739 [Exophiala viscosa]|uniref:Uncharacterized protein n=1 Tax=Exophiala viscosa TaxID=2486360 RepID=A0AAN6E2B5_9EURO|nr:hypothetical protein EDD36DRAFT_461739 [Exophiala viscosa]